MARVITKIGDIFCAQIDSKTKKYLQYIANDLTQLNSDVIRVFKKSYFIKENPDISIIINDEVDFYVHCVTKWGVKLGFWEKVGNNPIIGSLDSILFRGTNDSGRKFDEPPIRISHNWYVWRINDKNFTRVGKLTDDNRRAEIGDVIPPDSILYRMLHGEYDFVYPSFE